MTQAELADMFAFLDELRESGITNMYGASPYLGDAYALDEKEAIRITVLWMNTFDRDHTPDERATAAMAENKT